MNCTNNEKNSNFDYRVDGNKLADIVAIKVPFRGRILSFSKPNIAALFLDYSYVLWFTSQHTYLEHKFTKDHSNVEVPVKGWNDEFQLFHTLEQKMASIIFAYTALESFANEHVPEKFVYKKVHSNGKPDEYYSKDQIERSINLDIKLGEILPQVFGTKTPKGVYVWERYLHLKGLRDSIVHCKSIKNSSGANKVFDDILNETVINPCLEAKEVIGYFLSPLPEDEQPMWFKDFYKIEKETPKEFFDWADPSGKPPALK